MGSRRTFLLIAAAALAAPSIASAQETGTRIVVVGAMQDTGTRIVVIGGAMQDTGTRIVVVGAAQDQGATPAARTSDRAPPVIPVVYEDEPAPAPAPARTPAPAPQPTR